jgi:hypothetical protein
VMDGAPVFNMVRHNLPGLKKVSKKRAASASPKPMRVSMSTAGTPRRKRLPSPTS